MRHRLKDVKKRRIRWQASAGVALGVALALGMSACRFDAGALSGSVGQDAAADRPWGDAPSADGGPGDGPSDGGSDAWQTDGWIVSDGGVCSPEGAWCSGNTLVVCEGGTLHSETCVHGCNETHHACNVCEPGLRACTSGQVFACSSDGMTLEQIQCAMGCEGTAPPRCWQVDPRNGLAAALDSGSGDVTLQADVGHFYRANTDTGSLRYCSGDPLAASPSCVNVDVGAVFTVVAQVGGPEIGVWSFESLAVAQGTLIRFVGTRAAALTCRTRCEIGGVLQAGAHGRTPGPGGGLGGASEQDGSGIAYGEGGGDGNSRDDAGGGGGGLGGSGGSGGYGGSTQGGAGGQAAGNAEGTPLVGGSGGGGGGDNDGGSGGGGGGALQIVAGESLWVGPQGIITAGGGGGGGGGVSGCSDNGAGGGGGSGGMILLEAPIVVLEVGAVVAANGGGGGSGSRRDGGNRDWCQDGMSGEDGKPSADPALGGGGGDDGGQGGKGGAGSTLNGDTGGSGMNGGGGGGGVGRIRINTHNDAGLQVNGLLSPTLGTPAATRGSVGRR